MVICVKINDYKMYKKVLNMLGIKYKMYVSVKDSIYLENMFEVMFVCDVTEEEQVCLINLCRAIL